MPPENGERRLTAAEVDGVLGSFTARRREGRALGKGEVFRYQEFVNACHGIVGEAGAGGF